MKKKFIKNLFKQDEENSYLKDYNQKLFEII